MEFGIWYPCSVEIMHNYNLVCHFSNIKAPWNRAFEKKNLSLSIFAQLDITAVDRSPAFQHARSTGPVIPRKLSLGGRDEVKGKKFHKTLIRGTKLARKIPNTGLKYTCVYKEHSRHLSVCPPLKIWSRAANAEDSSPDLHYSVKPVFNPSQYL